jgi:flagellar hook-basal body complex protein FliE
MDWRSIGSLPLSVTTPLAPAGEVAGTRATPTPARPAAEDFGKALAEALEGLSRLQQEADARALQLAAGEPVELHEVMLAQDRASLGLQLAVQVRNKLVEAYQEIMRLQV